jgi:hypothetical protein
MPKVSRAIASERSGTDVLGVEIAEFSPAEGLAETIAVVLENLGARVEG